MAMVLEVAILVNPLDARIGGMILLIFSVRLGRYSLLDLEWRGSISRISSMRCS
jgi:hypothetical protein